MVTIGVLVRVDEATSPGVEQRLNEIPGVGTFELEEPGTVGVLIQARDLDDAHDSLCRRVRAVDGVLCAWPVHTQLET